MAAAASRTALGAVSVAHTRAWHPEPGCCTVTVLARVEGVPKAALQDLTCGPPLPRPHGGGRRRAPLVTAHHDVAQRVANEQRAVGAARTAYGCDGRCNRPKGAGLPTNMLRSEVCRG